MRIIASDISKEFGERKIFRAVDFTVRKGQSLAITGPNGSGKTTLIRILCGLIRPTSGTIEYWNEDRQIDPDHIYKYIGLVGPYLELYEELSAWENLRFIAKIKGLGDWQRSSDRLLDKFRLKGREDDAVKTYSSGMKQRLKYVFALLHRPPILLLDEPTSNLDSEGVATVYSVMERQKSNDILILATNDQDDLKFGDTKIAVSA